MSSPPSRLTRLAVILCVFIAIAGLSLGVACVVRFFVWPAKEMGQLFLLILYAVVVPGQLIPALGVAWAILLWRRDRPPGPWGWTTLTAWLLVSLGLLLLGLWGLLLHG